MQFLLCFFFDNFLGLITVFFAVADGLVFVFDCFDFAFFWFSYILLLSLFSCFIYVFVLMLLFLLFCYVLGFIL